MSLEPKKTLIEIAMRMAGASGCQKSNRGAALWEPLHRLYFQGTNHPAHGICRGDEACRAACSRICVHAEQAVLLACASYRASLSRQSEMLHVKTVNGVLVPSGPPSCIECSKLMLASGVGFMWLFHEAGWRHYTMSEFHTQTLRTLGLPDLGEKQ